MSGEKEERVLEGGMKRKVILVLIDLLLEEVSTILGKEEQWEGLKRESQVMHISLNLPGKLCVYIGVGRRGACVHAKNNSYSPTLFSAAVDHSLLLALPIFISVPHFKNQSRLYEVNISL